MLNGELFYSILANIAGSVVITAVFLGCWLFYYARHSANK